MFIVRESLEAKNGQGQSQLESTKPRKLECHFLSRYFSPLFTPMTHSNTEEARSKQQRKMNEEMEGRRIERKGSLAE